jgi:aldose 1-epimerase
MKHKKQNMKNIHILSLLLILIINQACMTPKQNNITEIEPSNFEKIIDNKQIGLYTIKNRNGLVCEIINFGARVVSLWAPDASGNFDDVALGYDNIEDYLDPKDAYYGATVGRYANRIANGKFILDSIEYSVETNNGPNQLHGGTKGFHRMIWDVVQKDAQTLELNYFSKDGESGYPGNMTVKMQYQLTDKNELKVEYWAKTDKTTLANFTHHSYFNLKGAGNGSINDHVLLINADRYTPVDETLIPTGILASVENTPFDFREPTAIGDRVDADFDQINIGKGYDHNYVLNENANGLHFAARVLEPKSGRTMEVYTSQPGMQFYGGNFMDGSDIGKQNKPYKHREALCLETQTFPDSPNKEHFPNAVLRPGEEYNSVCIYKFGTVK